jgi:hypothetical protein
MGILLIFFPFFFIFFNLLLSALLDRRYDPSLDPYTGFQRLPNRQATMWRGLVRKGSVGSVVENQMGKEMQDKKSSRENVGQET